MAFWDRALAGQRLLENVSTPLGEYLSSALALVMFIPQ
jgi:hypothetical protein